MAVRVEDKLDFVISQCRTLPNARFHGSYTMIKCPFHADNNPSGRISHSPTTRSPGYFKCYGCGATATWDKLAPLIGAQPFNDKPHTRYAEIKAFTTDEEQTNDYETLVLSELPAHKFWRSISTDLLIEVGCRVCRVKYDSGNLSEKFVYMPVIVDGDTKGYIKARMKKKEGKPSYVNLRGNWVSKFGLFPFDYAIQKMVNRTMVLVEGQRDALRLLSFGIPAMCIMGTQNWSADKARLLEMHGVDNIYIFMDGDDAGIHGTEKIWHTSHDLFNTKVIKLWELQGSPWLKYKDLENPSKAAKENGEELYDPGNCPDVILHKLRNKIYKD